jgi:hypothetical protein
MIEPQPQFDPHGLKGQGANSLKSSHVNEPYQHQEFPATVYRTPDTKVVHNAAELAAAIADGWRETSAEATLSTGWKPKPPAGH